MSDDYVHKQHVQSVITLSLSNINIQHVLNIRDNSAENTINT